MPSDATNSLSGLASPAPSHLEFSEGTLKPASGEERIETLDAGAPVGTEIVTEIVGQIVLARRLDEGLLVTVVAPGTTA